MPYPATLALSTARAEALGVGVAVSPGEAAPDHAARGRVIGVVGAVDVEVAQAGEQRRVPVTAILSYTGVGYVGDRAGMHLARLLSRGNLKVVERRLGVSYPRARAWLDATIDRLGLRSDEHRRLETLRALARGR